MVSQSNQTFYIATNEGFFLGSAPTMELLLSHSCFVFILVFFSVNQLHWLVCLRKLSTSVLSLLYELMLIHPFYYIRGATHVILSISTLKNIYGSTHILGPVYGEHRRTINANDSAGLELAEEAQYKV